VSRDDVLPLSGSVMSVLGDKIAANILAQTAKVPSIPWSGDGLTAELNAEGTIPDEIFNKVRRIGEGSDPAMGVIIIIIMITIITTIIIILIHHMAYETAKVPSIPGPVTASRPS
jgi:hypothetical protein